jgi:hypothetical protein
MRRHLGLVAIGLTLALGLASSFAAPPATATEHASEVIEGEVTKIDVERSRVTIRGSDGSLHEFEASAETLRDLKLGDRIEAKRRPAD